MDAFATVTPQYPSSSFAPTTSRSPVFDFDQEWAEHVTSLRSTTKVSSMGAQPSPPSLAESYLMELQYDGATLPQQVAQSQWTDPSASVVPQPWDGAFWAEEQWSGVRQYYGAYSASPQAMSSSSNSFPSSASSSTLRSPTTSRGSKRSSAETSPSSSKRRRVGSLSQEQQVSQQPKRGLFYLDTSNDDEEPEYQGPWEIVQGAWDDAVLSPDLPPQIAPVLRVREMPKLREPAPRLPAQVWETLRIVQ